MKKTHTWEDLISDTHQIDPQGRNILENYLRKKRKIRNPRVKAGLLKNVLLGGRSLESIVN